MPQATYHFPRGFLWGTATAAYQVEGNNTNSQWWKFEEDGHTNGRSGLACDWWGGRWREDFDRAAEDGQNAHRFSVEWSRIQPEPDRWDEDALDRYRTMLRGLKERGMTPMVTLHHFSDPIWLFERNGWENEDVVPLFEKFVRKTVEALKEYVNLWVTINEPNVYTLLGYAGDIFPAGNRGIRKAVEVMANMLRGHAAAYHAIHEIQPEARVGYAWAYRPVQAAKPWSPLDRLMRTIRYNVINLAFPSAILTGKMKTLVGKFRVPEARGTQDFFGLNYYAIETIKFDLTNRAELFTRTIYPEGTDISDSKYVANTPEGLFQSLKWATRTFPNQPIIITENGVADADDDMRPRYIAQHVHQLWRAVNFNWPLKGYFYWTLTDNFEWDRGWSERFGLWALDPATQKRTKRPSADLYAAICKENALSWEMVQKYCPEVTDKLFPV